MPRVSVVVPVYNVEEFLEACLDSLRRADVRGLRGDPRRRRLDRPQRRDRPALCRPRQPLPRRHPGQRRPQQGAQHRAPTPRQGEFLVFLDSDDALPPNAYELLVGALEKTGSDFATGQRPPAHALRHVPVAVPRQDVPRDAAEDPRHQVPPAARRPDGVEQALAPLVLGRARLPLPRGADLRGHAGHRPRALPRRARST